jgi:hypothetical protein
MEASEIKENKLWLEEHVYKNRPAVTIANVIVFQLQNAYKSRTGKQQRQLVEHHPSRLHLGR